MGLLFKFEFVDVFVLSEVDFLEVGLLDCNELVFISLNLFIEFGDQLLVFLSNNGYFLLLFLFHFHQIDLEIFFMPLSQLSIFFQLHQILIIRLVSFLFQRLKLSLQYLELSICLKLSSLG